MSENAALVLINDSLQDLRDDIRELRADGSERGRRIWARFEEQSKLLADQGRRLAEVEDALRTAAPALKELSETKLRAEGAGWLGRALWRFGVALISGAVVLYSSWEKVVALIRWLAKS